jgi:LmbE family N-acetylglucosaminyl deacetylase
LVLFYLLSAKIVIEKTPSPGKVLVIGAHPDDIEIAAGASIAKLHDAGFEVRALVLSHGERGGDADSRLTEAEIGAQFLEMDDVQVMDFHDTQMQNQAIEIVNAIERIIREYEPDMIFTHSRHDLHQDHQTVYESTLRAARNLRTTILCYESPSVTDEFVPIYYIDVCGYVDVKIEAIRKHWDQHKKPYMNPDLIRSKLNFRGNQAKIDFAEGFEVVRMTSRI